MVATFLGTCPGMSLQESFKAFLAFYGVAFDPLSTWLDGTRYIEATKAFSDCFVVIDPVDRYNNTAKSAFRFMEVQDRMRKATFELSSLDATNLF